MAKANETIRCLFSFAIAEKREELSRTDVWLRLEYESIDSEFKETANFKSSRRCSIRMVYLIITPVLD